MDKLMRSENFRKYLLHLLEDRKKKNVNYSMRAMAKNLEINPGNLSDLLSGKRKISEKKIQNFVDLLNLSPIETDSILSNFSHGDDTRIVDKSSVISLDSWVYDCILELVQIKNFRHTPQKIAERLKINKTKIEHAINLLLEKKFLNRHGNQLVPKSLGTQVFVQEMTSKELKKIQLDANLLSKQSLEKDPLKKRYHGTNTLAVDPDKIDDAKKFIRDFRKRFCSRLKNTDPSSKVYQLNISFYCIEDS